MRTLEELIEAEEPAWPVVEQMLAEAGNSCEVLAPTGGDGARTLVAIQVTTRSPMGAIAYQTGGILVDHGWIRVLGAGHPRLPRDLARWNSPHDDHSRPRMPRAFLVADDVIGGFFAVNGGAFEGLPGNVFYLSPDSLRWEDLGRGYTDFIRFVFSGNLATFYDGQRWRGWQDDVSRLTGDHAFQFYPFLWTNCDAGIDARSRNPVPIDELWGLHAVDIPKQLFGGTGV